MTEEITFEKVWRQMLRDLASCKPNEIATAARKHRENIRIAVSAELTERRSQMLSKRIKDGLARSGRKGGRPAGQRPVRVDMATVRRLRKEGKSLLDIAGVVGVSRATLCKRLAEAATKKA